MIYYASEGTMARRKEVEIPITKLYSDVEPCAVFVFRGDIVFFSSSMKEAITEQEEYNFFNMFEDTDDYHHIAKIPNSGIIVFYPGSSTFGENNLSFADIVGSLKCKHSEDLRDYADALYKAINSVMNPKEQYPYMYLFKYDYYINGKRVDPEKATKDDILKCWITYAEIDFTDTYQPVKVFEFFDILSYKVGYGCKRAIFGFPGQSSCFTFSQDYPVHDHAHKIDLSIIQEVVDIFINEQINENPNICKLIGTQHILYVGHDNVQWIKNGYKL